MLASCLHFIFCFALLKLSCAQSAPPSGLIPTLLELNSGWSRMPYNLSQSSWIPNLYRLSTPLPVRFQFTDAFCPGERVSVFVNGTLLANSTDVPIPAASCAPNLPLPEGTAAYPQVYSQLDLELPAGQHEIAFQIIQNNPAFNTGIMFTRAYIEYDSGCPCSN